MFADTLLSEEASSVTLLEIKIKPVLKIYFDYKEGLPNSSTKLASTVNR